MSKQQEAGTVFIGTKLSTFEHEKFSVLCIRNRVTRGVLLRKLATDAIARDDARKAKKGGSRA